MLFADIFVYCVSIVSQLENASFFTERLLLQTVVLLPLVSERISVGLLEPSHFQQWDGFHVILPIRAVPLFACMHTLLRPLIHISGSTPEGWDKRDKRGKGAKK